MGVRYSSGKYNADKYNALKLKGRSENALLALALKYELVTGVRVKWRQDSQVIFDMVEYAMKSEDAALFGKAVSFLGSLPLEVRDQFELKGMPPVLEEANSLVADESSSRPIGIERSTRRKRFKVWRGQVYA